MPRITVTARITAGTHPVHGPIVEGQRYEIEEHQFADQLFYAPGEEPASAPAAPGKPKRR